MRMQAYRHVAVAGHRPTTPAAGSRWTSSSAAWQLLRQRRPRAAAVRALGRHGARALRRGRAGLDCISLAMGGRRPPSRHGALRATGRRLRRPHRRLVDGIEAHMSRWTALHAPAADGADGPGRDWARAVLLYTGYLLRAGAGGPAQAGDRAASRAATSAPASSSRSSDEFGTLAAGFNEHGRAPAVDVPQPGGQGGREDRASCEEKRERLAGLYEVTTLVASATTLDELAARLHAAHRARRACRRRGAALVRREQPALPDAGQRRACRRPWSRRSSA